MKCRSIAFVVLLLLAGSVFAADLKKRPAFQYKSAGIEVSIPNANEPRVAAFGADTIQAAAKYLDDGAISWVREKSCINCHTTGPYLAERPALTRFLGKPNAEVLTDFVKSIPEKPSEEKERDGVKYYPGVNQSIWRTLGLAEWDKHITGKLSDHTVRSLRDMLLRQSGHGGFVAVGEVEIPHITTDFELSLQAARAIVAAPGWLASLQDAELLRRVARLKSFLRDARPRNDYETILRLQLSALFPDLVSQAERAAALALLTQKQHPDGGWSLRDMSATDNWRTPMSKFVLQLIANLPDAANPASDPYMTAFAIILLRDNGIPATDPRIQRGIAWLKQEQRVSGRWWMHSLYRGNYHYITYIATAQAVKALAACGEIH